ncbi:hypothetical protein [Desertimonas flava]|uniref:hypothetical protein n=1 Tax=Desertimonas flava TaxID=2064846 RepID=UPI000E34D2BA|nr:hypothetical protein [Desertimonas flava]
MGALIGFLRAADIGDCTNGGTSGRHVRCVVVNVPGPFDPSPDSPAMMLVPGAYGAPILVDAVRDGNGGWKPAESGPDGKTIGPMAGGNYAATHGSWRDIVADMTATAMFDRNYGRGPDLDLEGLRRLARDCAPHAVAVHDRWETPAQYDQLSR